MENKVLELCKKVIDGEAPGKICRVIDCRECPFRNMKTDCDINSIEMCIIAQNYIKEHKNTVYQEIFNVNDNDYKKGFNDGFEYAMKIMKNKLEEMKKMI